MAVKKKAKGKTVAKKAAKGKSAKKVMRTAAKKSSKKGAMKKAAPKVFVKPAAVKSVSKAYTKSQIMTYLAEQAGISRKEATAAYEALTGLLGAHLKSKVGSFAFPGIAKCVVVHKPATKARKGINPFTKEPTMFKAKPARNIVKVRALKALKDMVK